MTKVAVYHMTREAFRDGLDEAGSIARNDIDEATKQILAAIEANQYRYCAQLNLNKGDVLNETWRLTNNVEESWVENEQVIYDASRRQGQRSSMMGDIFLIVEDSGASEAHIVGSFGFTKLPAVIAEKIINAQTGVSDG